MCLLEDIRAEFHTGELKGANVALDLFAFELCSQKRLFGVASCLPDPILGSIFSR